MSETEEVMRGDVAFLCPRCRTPMQPAYTFLNEADIFTIGCRLSDLVCPSCYHVATKKKEDKNG